MTLPELPYDAWKDTKTKVHLISQIVGKVRLTLNPASNHWWHAPLYVSVHGLSTRAIPYRGRSVEVELDFVEHQTIVRTSDGGERTIPLRGVSVSDFYVKFFAALLELGVDVGIVAVPFDPERVGSDIAFADDTAHTAYDPGAVQRFWQALVSIDSVFQEFRGRFVGKCSPVHLFWHSFDLAVTRFSGRPAPVSPDADPVTASAYSHENISAGFWAGDAAFPEPAFYSYTYPEPDGLADEPLQPAAAWWQEQNGTHMALLRYEDVRTAADPRAALLAFMQSSYEAGAKRAEWPRAELEV